MIASTLFFIIGFSGESQKYEKVSEAFKSIIWFLLALRNI